MILLDTNVLVATLWADHPHHQASAPLAEAATPQTTMVALHSVAETYATMTRINRPFRLTGEAAMAAITALIADIRIVTLDGPQTIDAIGRFTSLGGCGPRLYDYLIGAAAEARGADTIVTWNTRDFDGLFPALRIVTPAALQPAPPP